MIRERFKELVDFATTESPYRDATKGWLTDDVYLKWGPSEAKASTQANEIANVSVFWKPINQIVLILFSVIFLASIFVFSAVSLANGRFQIPTASSLMTTEITQTQLKESIDQEQSSTSLTPELEPVVEKKIELEKSSQTIDFGAAALGGQKFSM